MKADRTEQDILFELLLKLGLDLTVPIDQKTIAGKAVHSIGFGSLMVCLAPKIDRKDVEPLGLGIVAGTRNCPRPEKPKSSSATAPSPTTWRRRISPQLSSSTAWGTSGAYRHGEAESHHGFEATRPGPQGESPSG